MKFNTAIAALMSLTNQFYDKENQTVQHFRFDPLEARNWSGGSTSLPGRKPLTLRISWALRPKPV